MTLTLIRDGSDDLEVNFIRVIMLNKDNHKVVYECPKYQMDSATTSAVNECHIAQVVF